MFRCEKLSERRYVIHDLASNQWTQVCFEGKEDDEIFELKGISATVEDWIKNIFPSLKEEQNAA